MSLRHRSNKRFVRVGVAIAALAAAAAFAAESSASITPNLVISQPVTNVAGGTGSVTFNATFASGATTDSVSDFSIALPPGMLINEMTAGGGCLSQPGPTPACQIGSGTATLNGTATPLALYLMKPANQPADLAGLFLSGAPFPLPGDLTMHSTSSSGINPSLLVGEEIDFHDLPASLGLTSLSLTLTGLSLPSSCLPSAAVLSTDSQLQPNVPMTFSAPYTLTGCLALGYAPGVTETVARDPAPSTGGVLTISVATPPGDSSTQSMRLRLPPNLVLNPALDPCFSGQVCTVGTITEISPVFPSSQLSGSLTLAGTERAPTLAITFPAPLGLSLFTTFSTTQLNLLALPDIPTTNMTLTFIGNSLGRMFTVLCYPTIYKAVLAPRSGASTVNLDGAVAEPGCRQESGAPAKPSATAAISGGGAKAVRLSLMAKAASGSAGIASLKIGLPAGLRFASGILQRGGKVARGALSVSGAKLASVHLRGGALAVTFARATSQSRLSLASPLLLGSPKRHGGNLRVTITDGRGARTTLSVSLDG